jgi:hypothetical protein
MKTLQERVEAVRKAVMEILDLDVVIENVTSVDLERAKQALRDLPAESMTEKQLNDLVQSEIGKMPRGKTYDPVALTIWTLEKAGALLVRKDGV